MLQNAYFLAHSNSEMYLLDVIMKTPYGKVVKITKIVDSLWILRGLKREHVNPITRALIIKKKKNQNTTNGTNLKVLN